MAYVTKDIAEGKPETDCAEALMEEIKGMATPAGIVSIITGLVLFTAMCGAFPLCTGFSDDMGEEDK